MCGVEKRMIKKRLLKNKAEKKIKRISKKEMSEEKGEWHEYY